MLKIRSKPFWLVWIILTLPTYLEVESGARGVKFTAYSINIPCEIAKQTQSLQ